MNDIIRKVYPFEVKAVGERVLEFIGSTEDVDRDGEVILAAGWDLKNYKTNPVFMWAHRYMDPPIGKANRVWVKDNKLHFHIEFADAETYEFADTIFKLYKGGFLKATSVGFIPMEWEDGDGHKAPRRTYKKQELLELSAVPVPANPTALISEGQANEEGIDMGVLVKAFEDAAVTETEYQTKPEETETQIRIPVKGEEGKHEGHRIRTIDIDKQKGITALYCGECKKVITYLFDKEKGWTMATAQQWVRDHARGVSLSVVMTHAVTQGDVVWEHGEITWVQEVADRMRQAAEEGNYIPLTGAGDIPWVIEPYIAEPSSDDTITPYVDEKVVYQCECIECGHRLESEKHCRELKCPKCGGKMRRRERPGPGQEGFEEVDEGVFQPRTRAEAVLSQEQIKDDLDFLRATIDDRGLADDTKEIAWELVRGILRATGGDIPDYIMAEFCEAIEAKQDDADDQPVVTAIDRQELAKLIAGMVQAYFDRLKGVVR